MSSTRSQPTTTISPGWSATGSSARPSGQWAADKPAVVVRDLGKRFRVYHERHQSLKAMLLSGRKSKYEEFWALRDVNLEIYPGETVSFIGHNGSGKSTMLKCIAGILEPDEGSAVARGRVSALLELGAGFHPELSGRENVFLNGALLGMSQRTLKDRFDDIVQFAGLEQFIDHPVKNYSSGMYARLGFSIAINVDPEILLVDEVLAVGDEAFQRRCAERISDLRGQGKTIVVVSHSLGQVRSLSDRIVWFDHGRVQMVGNPVDVADAYLEATGQTLAHEGDGDESAEKRIGTGEVRIDRVTVTPWGDGSFRSDTGGNGLVPVVRTGDPVHLDIYWSGRVPLGRRYELGITFTHSSGVLTAASRSMVSTGGGMQSGRARLTLDAFPLVAGSYHIGAGVAEVGSGSVIDWKSRHSRVEVTPRKGFFDDGLAALLGTWTDSTD